MQSMINSLPLIASVSIAVIIAVVFLVYGISQWLFPDIDLSSEKTGNKELDKAQRKVDNLDLELGIMEDLGRSTSPDTLNALRGRLNRAEETLALEMKNEAEQQKRGSKVGEPALEHGLVKNSKYQS